MRKIASSANAWCSVAFSACADSRSRPNGFSMTTRAPDVQPGLREMLDDLRKGAWRNREIKQRTLRVAERLPNLRERLEIGVVARHVLQQRGQARERRLVDGPRSPTRSCARDRSAARGSSACRPRRRSGTFSSPRA